MPAPQPYPYQDRGPATVKPNPSSTELADMHRRLVKALPYGGARNQRIQAQPSNHATRSKFANGFIEEESGAFDLDFGDFTIFAHVHLETHPVSYTNVVDLHHFNSTSDNYMVGVQSKDTGDTDFQYFHRHDSTAANGFTQSLPSTWFILIWHAGSGDVNFYIEDEHGNVILNSTHGYDGAPDADDRERLQFDVSGDFELNAAYLFDGQIDNTDILWENPRCLLHPRPNRAVTFAGTKIYLSGGLTDGRETVDGFLYRPPKMSGALTDASETIDGFLYRPPKMSGAIVDGIDTIDGEGWALPTGIGAITDAGPNIDERTWATTKVGDDVVMVRSTLSGVPIAFQARSLSVTSQLQGCDTARFTELVQPGDTPTYRVGEPLRVYADEREDTAVFGGIVQERTIKDARASRGAKSGLRRVDYECVCFSHLAERRVIAGAWQNTVAGDVVRDIVSRTLVRDGVTTDNVEDGPEIEYLAYTYQRVSKLLDDLAEKTGYTWYIGPYRDLHFFSRESKTAPFSLTSSNQPYQSLSLREATEKYRNRQFVRGGKQQTDVRSETFSGDGRRRTFSVAFPIDEEPTVKVNGTVQELGIGGVEDNKQFYWNRGERSVYQDNDEPILESDDEVEVVYRGQIRLLMEKIDAAQVDERKDVEGTSGLHERVTRDADIRTRNQARDKATDLLRRFAEIREKLDFTTQKLGLEQGHILTVELPDLNIDAEYLIESVNYRVKDNNTFRMDVSALSGEPYGGWQDFFKHLVLETDEAIAAGKDEDVILLRTAVESLETLHSVTIAQPDLNKLSASESVTISESVTMTTETDALVIGTNDIGNKPIA